MTIGEIAKLAGVSKTTVSRVLNGKPDVSNVTAERIKKIIRDTGFIPNAFAKAINDKKTHTIGLIIPYSVSYIFSSQYFSELLRGISSYVDERLYHLMLCYPQSGNCAEIFKEGRVDGFIVITPSLNQIEILDDLKKAKAPFVLTSKLPGYMEDSVAYVDIDERKATRQAIEHLISLGHKRIACVGENLSASAQERTAEYRRCLLDYGIPCEEEYIRLSDEKDLPEAGCKEAQELMALPVTPTAIFCCADMIAIGVYKTLHTLGVQIPQNVSVVGFDDIFMCQYLNPPLTTVHQSAYVRGRTITEKLIDFLENGTSGEHIILEAYLKIRNSTGELKDNKEK
ncbi:MAG TPA: LacI family transcriptional regulator [Firmicutes bacterium]|nr:LacI family transcriptional regulator [Bacillota bacterium]